MIQVSVPGNFLKDGAANTVFLLNIKKGMLK